MPPARPVFGRPVAGACLAEPPGGACTLFDKGQQADGTWETADDMSSLRFVNGQTFALAYSLKVGF